MFLPKLKKILRMGTHLKIRNFLFIYPMNIQFTTREKHIQQSKQTVGDIYGEVSNILVFL